MRYNIDVMNNVYTEVSEMKLTEKTIDSESVFEGRVIHVKHDKTIDESQNCWEKDCHCCPNMLLLRGNFIGKMCSSSTT